MAEQQHKHHDTECAACSCAEHLSLVQKPCNGECECHHEHEHEQATFNERKEWLKVISSALLLIVAVLLERAELGSMQWWLPHLFYLTSFLIIATTIMKEAWELLTRHLDFFNECSLMTIASFGAFAIGEHSEAVLLMLLYNIGEILQARAVNKAKRSISDLVDVRPDNVVRLTPQGTEEVIPAHTAEVGYLLRARVGDRLSLDGMLISGHASLNLSALTGESLPAELTEGDEVLAGSVVEGQPIEYRVTKPYTESTLARILEMAEAAAERKPETERFIRRFARVYTPIVFTLALLVIAVPWVVSLLSSSYEYQFSTWLYRSLVFLVTSCPCALVISVPLTYFSGLGAASRKGILFKGAIFLERLRRVQAVLFDKTGTLTEGHFEVTTLHVTGSLPEAEALAILAQLEAQSTHPIAEAIVRYSQERTLPQVAVTDVQEKAGFGLTASYQGQPVHVGNRALMEQAGLTAPASIEGSVASVVYLSVGQEVVLAVELADQIKPTAKATIARLHQKGLAPLVMISGDKPAVVEAVVREIGLDRAHGGLLPQDKMHHVETLMQQEGKQVAFLGDGLNDAPVMGLCDVGIAMGGIASDATIEAADVVIQGFDPYKLVEAYDISQLTHKVVWQNISFALSFKLVVMVLAILGYASLPLAIIADVGVTLLAVLNAIRVLSYKGE